MLYCVNDAIFPQRNFPTRVQEILAVAQSKTATRKTATRSGKSRQSSKTKATKQTKTAKPASRKTKASTSKGRSKAGSKAARDTQVTIDRRRTGRRTADRDEEVKGPVLAAPKLERRKKVNRRRQIDPTTCERDYSDDEIQFMNAMDGYKRASGRMFPTCSEVLEVLRTLGYVKLSSAETKAYEAPAFAEAATASPTDSDPDAADPSI
jgi:hypothetical protein